MESQNRLSFLFYGGEKMLDEEKLKNKAEILLNAIKGKQCLKETKAGMKIVPLLFPGGSRTIKERANKAV